MQTELTEVSRNNYWPSSLLCIFQHQAVTFVFRGPQAAFNRQLRISVAQKNPKLAKNQQTQHNTTCSLHLQHQGALNSNSAALEWPWASPRGHGDTQGGTVPPGSCTRIRAQHAPHWIMDMVTFVHGKNNPGAKRTILIAQCFSFSISPAWWEVGGKCLSLFFKGVLLTK